jgi:hypothetical protein
LKIQSPFKVLPWGAFLLPWVFLFDSLHHAMLAFLNLSGVRKVSAEYFKKMAVGTGYGKKFVS